MNKIILIGLLKKKKKTKIEGKNVNKILVTHPNAYTSDFSVKGRSVLDAWVFPARKDLIISGDK